MILTSTFSKEARQNRKAAREQKKRSRIEKQLEELAAKLPEEIKKARQEKKPGMNFFINGLELYSDATKFSGYQQLHKICASADIRIEKTTFYGGTIQMPQMYGAIVVNFDRPYSASPDAPKKPVWIQPPLPGL